MTVCFEFDPVKQPWIIKYDRFDTSGNRWSDDKISTYDVKDVWTAFRGWDFREPMRTKQQCEAFRIEMMAKLRFHYKLFDLEQWRKGNKEEQIKYVRDEQAEALAATGAHDGDNRYEGSYMGEAWEAPWYSARHFINCVADEVVKGISNNAAPPIAGAGIVVSKEKGQYPQIVSVIPEARRDFEKYGVSNPNGLYISWLKGADTKDMTLEEVNAALSGPDGTFVKLGLARYDLEHAAYPPFCSGEPEIVKWVTIHRSLSKGEIMTNCGGLDL